MSLLRLGVASSSLQSIIVEQPPNFVGKFSRRFERIEDQVQSIHRYYRGDPTPTETTSHIPHHGCVVYPKVWRFLLENQPSQHGVITFPVSSFTQSELGWIQERSSILHEDGEIAGPTRMKAPGPGGVRLRMLAGKGQHLMNKAEISVSEDIETDFFIRVGIRLVVKVRAFSDLL